MVSAIEVRDVHKLYRRYSRRKNFGTLKSALLSGNVFSGLRPDETFEALRGVSFDVAAGQTFGIIGRNGSGKSTMLKLIAGIGKPTRGALNVNGRVSALIELGAGFHPEISGRENVFINGMMLGLTKGQIASRFDEIVRFAELEEFIDAPVKTYSSGMYMRLGFAVAINVDPDVLLVDEVLAVGDETFTHKCLDKFAEFRRRGKTVLLVTHSLDMVTRFCDQALWLDEGRVAGQGDPKRVIDAYLLDVARAENQTLVADERRRSVVDRESSAGPTDLSTAGEGRWGSREVEITGVELRSGQQPTHVFESGASIEIRLTVRAAAPVTDFVFGIGLFNSEGLCCYGTNTHIEGAKPEELSGQAHVVFTIHHLDLIEGSYKVDVAVHKENGTPYDYHRLLYDFRVTAPTRETGVYRPPHRWSFDGAVRFTAPPAERTR
jgi:ABC-type polysaccharide/polyol phosphate transport system ATPase subunit